MATFAEKNFDSDNYKTTRPYYPTSLFDTIFNYHKGNTTTAIDVGSGPGIASFALLNYVDKVIATDPSEVMIKSGIESITPDIQDRISFHVSPAEDLKSVAPEDGSIDIITSAEALHWFNHEAFFKEAARVLRSGGTLSYWGYIEPRFIDFPKADEIYEKYVFEDDRYMGPEWKPGKEFLRYFFKDVVIPSEYFEEIEKHDYYPNQTETKTAYFFKDYEFTMRKLEKYLSSWSAYYSWKENHPEAEKDVVQMFIEELKETFGWEDDTVVRVEWGSTYVMARRK